MDGRALYFEWEVNIMSMLQEGLGPVGKTLAVIFTNFGEELILVLVFGLIYWCFDKRSAKIIGTNLIVGILINPMIKNIVLRRRPYFVHETIDCLKPVNKEADIYDITFQGYSFPSAHSLNSTVMYASLWRVWRKRVFCITAFILPFLVGISRIILGNHYPTDVLTGWLLGALIVIFLPMIQTRVKNENRFRLIIFLISLLGIFYCRTDDYFTGLGLMAGFFLSVPFEEKYVKFSETKHPGKCALRVIGGFAFYYLFNTLLKLPFSEEFLKSDIMSAHLVRATRYTIVVFILFALYPMLFDKIRFRENHSSSAIS